MTSVPSSADDSAAPTGADNLADRLNELALQAALLKHMQESVAAKRDAVDAEFKRIAPSGYTMRPTVETPDGRRVQVATISRTFPGRGVRITNQEAFNAWVSEHYPTEITIVEVVNPAWQKLIKIGRDGGLVGPNSEAEIPGVEIVQSDGVGNVTTKLVQENRADLWAVARTLAPELLQAPAAAIENITEGEVQ